MAAPTIRCSLRRLGGVGVGLVFIFVEEEVFLRGIVWPNVFDHLVDFAIVFELLEVFYHFEGSTRALSVVDEFVLSGWPWGIFEARGQFEGPVHSVYF